jgi:hypothetical protein
MASKMEAKDVVIAIFGAAVGLAGILLVVVGFVYSHGETLELKADRDKYKLVAKSGIAPFLICLLCAVFCLIWMSNPSPTIFCWLRWSLYVGMGLTALYGVVAFLFYL